MKDSTIFDKQIFPINCEECEQLGYIFIDDLNGSYFIVCQKCGGETSEVSCPKCNMGGSFVRDIENRPSTWTCEGCGSTYSLPPGFYENPVTLYELEKLPPEIQQRIKLEDEENRPKLTFRGALGLIIIIPVVSAVAAWPLAIMYFFGFMRGNFIGVVIGTAIMGIWIFFGFPKIQQPMSALITRIMNLLKTK
jgi:hypothetical protein